MNRPVQHWHWSMTGKKLQPPEAGIKAAPASILHLPKPKLGAAMLVVRSEH
jgi:hypothetical protein